MKSVPHAGYRERYVWVKEKDFRGQYVLSGLRTYLIQLENGKFEGRWNGVWNLPIKVADSINYAISLDGEEVLWLYDHCAKFEAHVSHAERTYRLPRQLVIKEKLFMPSSYRAVCWIFTIENRGNEDVQLKFIANPVVNLMWEVKQAGEPWRERRMLVIYDHVRGALLYRHHMRSEWIALFGANKVPNIVYAEHPGNSKLPLQSKIPRPREHVYGDALLIYDVKVPRGESFELTFVLVGGIGTLTFFLKEYDELLNKAKLFFEQNRQDVLRYLAETADLSTTVKSIDKAFTWSKVNLYVLKHYKRGYGLGYMAGLPNFPIYFGRDTIWTLLGVNAIGDFETSKAALSMLARFQAKDDGEDQLMVPYYKGEIPHEVRTDGTIIYYSIDATPLFIIGVYDYYLWTGDDVFIRYIYDNVYKALRWCFKSDRDGNGLIDHGPEGFLPDVTWMDSLFRGKSAVDVQAIFAYAFKCGAELAKIVEDYETEKEAIRRFEELKKLLVEKYWDDERGFFYDTIKPDGLPDASLTINAVVPLFFNLVDYEKATKVLAKLESSDFMAPWGVRSRAKSDPEYDSRSYQKGGVWPFCTGWVAFSQFQYGRLDKGLDTILRMAEAQRLVTAYFKEVLPGDGPIKEVLTEHEHPLGCFIQAWSAGIYIYALIKGLAGVEPKAYVKQATICPFLSSRLSEILLEELKVGSCSLDFRIQRLSDGEVKAKLYVKEGELNLNVGFKSIGCADTCRIHVNGEEVEGVIEPIGEGYFRILTPLDVKAGKTLSVSYRFK
ncbi:MAG: hypothetical protein DRJ31_03280 [Candidatus Methanomethylicota archaeon]|uniref:Glycogen debranching enzyme C-terminal domain-containing protein n=1 Tax=Thermoproteota archaeon TaxID=2056631 RepID=A0A497ERQ3_9CREN|nr:MAG: hypothetical protein DRJ31_03280 [Candidatus Verstraetearchaeota archaeon]